MPLLQVTEVVDVDVAGFQFDFLVGAGVVESAFPLDFDGGILGRVLLDVADEFHSRGFYLLWSDAIRWENRIRLALQVEGRGGLAEKNGARIGFHLRLVGVDLLGHLACADDEQACSQRVQSAGVANFQLADAVATVDQRPDEVDCVE